MKSSGMTRPIDELGRIVIPKEMRKALNLKPKDEVEFFVEDGAIVLKKTETVCALCGNAEELSELDGKHICKSCIEKIRNIP